jgi:hypothetical protein
MLIPVLNFKAGAVWNGSTQVEDALAEARKLSYTGVITLTLDEAALASGPKQELIQSILRMSQCCVGPLPVRSHYAASFKECVFISSMSTGRC